MTKPRYKWTPLRRATTFKPINEELIQLTMIHKDSTREEAIAFIKSEQKINQTWINDIYQVLMREDESGLVQLNIRRRDGGPILRDWRHFQQIKNELLGEECEAVELYPAESRKVDTANKFHLWGVKDPKFRFPFGFNERSVMYGDSKNPGMKQRPE